MRFAHHFFAASIISALALCLSLLTIMPSQACPAGATKTSPAAGDGNPPETPVPCSFGSSLYYEWDNNRLPIRGIVIAVHGLAMHGNTFDAVGERLSQRGFVVVAPDLRGYGRTWKSGKQKRTSYKKSEEDIALLAQELKSKYKGVPVFLAGESLGGSLAIRIAATHPQLVDGLILSAPAIEHFHHLPVRTIVDAAFILANPHHNLDVSGFIKNYYTEDPLVVSESLKDPLIRKRLGVRELLTTCLVINSTKHFVEELPADMPILVMQGTHDRMIKPSSLEFLEAHLQTHNKTVQLFPQRGHLLLETNHPRPETISTVCGWLNRQCHELHPIIAGDKLVQTAVEEPGT